MQDQHHNKCNMYWPLQVLPQLLILLLLILLLLLMSALFEVRILDLGHRCSSISSTYCDFYHQNINCLVWDLNAVQPASHVHVLYQKQNCPGPRRWTSGIDRIIASLSLMMMMFRIRYALKKKQYHLGIFPNMGGGVFPNPKTFVNLPSIFLYAKFILRC